MPALWSYFGSTPESHSVTAHGGGGMQAGTLRRPGLLAVEPSPFSGGEPRIRVRLEVEGDWEEAAVAERRQSHGEASTSGGDQSPSERDSHLVA